jgi:hypothetical protein
VEDIKSTFLSPRKSHLLQRHFRDVLHSAPITEISLSLMTCAGGHLEAAIQRCSPALDIVIPGVIHGLLL